MKKTSALLLTGSRRPSRQTLDELKTKGIQIAPAQDLGACLSALEADQDSVVIVDLDLHRKGLDDLREIHRGFPDAVALVLASLERLAMIDEALGQGAQDFVIKQPDLSHLHELPQVIARCQEKKRLIKESEGYRDEVQKLEANLKDRGAEAQRAQEEAERFRKEIERLQSECGRYQEQARSLTAALEEEKRPAGQAGAPATGQAGGDEVLAEIVEDLKSPLAAMMGYLEIASTIGPDRVEKNQLLALKRIDLLTRRLHEQVNNYTEALEIEAGRFEVQKGQYDLNHVVDMAVQDRKSEAEAKGIEIVVEKASDLPAVSIDAVQIERALGILISNAITLSPTGGSVTVESKLRDGGTAIAVKDSGVGIAQEEIPLLFDRSKRVRRRGADFNTVGLYVAHRIVTAHGGRIDVESDQAEGTTLTISLPT